MSRLRSKTRVRCQRSRISSSASGKPARALTDEYLGISKGYRQIVGSRTRVGPYPRGVPKMARPTRTMVAPSSMATSKSSLIPMLSSGSAHPVTCSM